MIEPPKDLSRINDFWMLFQKWKDDGTLSEDDLRHFIDTGRQWKHLHAHLGNRKQFDLVEKKIRRVTKACSKQRTVVKSATERKPNSNRIASDYWL